MNPLLGIAGLAIAFWPVWQWYVQRLTDGSDEPLNLLALATLIAFTWLHQAGAQDPQRNDVSTEGTLRVLALCCIATNPWTGQVIAFEEPENGVHPRRIELIAKLLASLALEQNRQVIVTTHSPLFCDAVLKLTTEEPDSVGLFNVRRDAEGTKITRFETSGPLFNDSEIKSALQSSSEDGMFESLMLRGMLDE